MVANSTHRLASGEPSPKTLKGVARYFAATRPAFLIASLLPVMNGIPISHGDCYRQ